MLNNIYAVFDRNAEAAAAAAHCTVKRHWVSKSKPGLANHAMAEITCRNLQRAGAPRCGAEAVAVAQRLQRELGFEPMPQPFAEDEAERRLRRDLPSWQTHCTSGDYTDMTLFRSHRALRRGPRRVESPAGFRLSRMGRERAWRHPGLHRSDGCRCRKKYLSSKPHKTYCTVDNALTTPAAAIPSAISAVSRGRSLRSRVPAR